ncbi:MAG: class I SAM-dependent DNA methyltransferase [Acidimicrobiales bacterium]
MPSVSQVEDQIEEVEGFRVRFVSPDGTDPTRRRVDDYAYANAGNRKWTVAKWRKTRFTPTYWKFDVEVFDGSGRPAHGKTLLSNLRATYTQEQMQPHEVTAPSPARSIEKAPARSEPRPDRKLSESSQTGRGATATGGSEPLGFEDTLWKAADKLRGSMDASEYKHVVLGLVFLKYIDDSFGERRAQLAADLAADGIIGEQAGDLLESRDEYTAEGVFWVPLEARWKHLQANAKQPDIGKLIDAAMDAVEVENPSLRGVLPKNFGRPSLDVRRLGELVDLIAGLGLGGAEHREKDLLGRVYEYFLGRFASQEGKSGGEFYTPRNVVKLLVEMIEPYKGRVYDPCCGSGGMFVQSEQFVEAHGGGRNDIAVYGQEMNDTTWRLAKMNLAIRGIESDLGPRWADTFHEDLHMDLKADFVLANPPFNVSDWGGDQLRDDPRWKYGVPPTGNANYAWLQHMASKLSPRGVAGILLANGSLSTQQSGEGDIRQRMVEGDLVECIVAMPSQLFYTTQIPVTLWFLDRDKTSRGSQRWRNRQGEVLFIDARKLGHLVDKTHRELTNEEIARIAGTYHAWRGEPSAGSYDDVAGFCACATAEQIAEHRFVLTPGRYVGAEDVEDDGEPIEEKLVRLKAELFAAFDESDRLQARVRAALEQIRG